MKIAVLIAAHKDPLQVEKLIQLLDNDHIDIYIHLDRKSNFNSFKYLAAKKRVSFIKNSVRTYRGEYSLIQATINSLEEIVKKGNYEYINFISGQDLPIQSAQYIFNFLLENVGCEFINTHLYNPSDPWWKLNESRILKYNLDNWRIPGKYKLQKIINTLLPKRKIPKGYILSGNSQWFCITKSCAEYVLDFIRSKPPLINYFKYVWGADEFFFSTIVYNSPFREQIRNNLHYVKWGNSEGGHPKILGVNDFDNIFNSGKLFARKFDRNYDEEIINLIENRILNNV